MHERIGFGIMGLTLMTLVTGTACTSSDNTGMEGMTRAEYREVKAFFESGKIIFVDEEPFTTWTPAQREAIKRMAAEAKHPLVGNEERY